jgi:hypothetical protein
MWIFGSWIKDALWLYIPGLVALLLAALLRPEQPTWAFLIFAFVAQAVLDSGHVYTTLWRTYLNPVERRRSYIYLWLPPVLFAVFFLWSWGEIPFLGAFVVYSTIFHNVRQFYGLSKWYQRLNGRYRPDSDHLLYFLCLVPVVMAHFRSDIEWSSYYARADVVFWPQPELFNFCLYVYVVVALFWLLYEARLVWQNRDEWPRTLSVAFPAAIYGSAFLLGRTQSEILFPLVVSHGLAYLALVGLSVRRTGRPRVNSSLALGLVFITAIIAGSLEHWGESWVDFSDPSMAFFVALVLTPLYCHYLFDAFLWKRSHPEAVLIYASAAGKT